MKDILDLIRDNAYNQALNDVLEIIPKDPKYLEILKAVLELHTGEVAFAAQILRRMEEENNKQYGNNSETIGETI